MLVSAVALGAVAFSGIGAVASAASHPNVAVAHFKVSSSGKCSGSVEVGISDPAQASAQATAAAGGGTQTTLAVGTYHRIYAQAFNYINAHGGLNGCKAVPEFYDFNGNGQYEVEAQQECTLFADTYHVAAAILTQSEPSPALTCLAGHNIPVVDAEEWLGPVDNAMFSQYKNLLYLPFLVTTDRLGEAVVALHAAGELPKSAKVGIVEWSNGSGAQAVLQHSYETALKKLGIPVEATFQYNLGGTLQNQLSELSADSKAVTLKFKSTGVNTLLSADAPGFMLFFPSYAASQDYYPKYLLTSLDNLTGQVAYNKPAFAKGGAAAFGWLPTWDLPYPAPAGEAPTDSAWSTCNQLYVGLPAPSSTFAPAQICDPVLWLQAALKHATSFSPAGLAKGVAALGTSYTSAATLGPSTFGSGDYDGPTVGKVLVFKPSQGAFQYVSNTEYQIP